MRTLDLLRLKLLIDRIIVHDMDKNYSNVPVLITLAESSMGARASCKVVHANLGMDWERNQFRIEPVVPLVRQGNSLLDVKEAKCKAFAGRNYYFCSTCDQKVAKDDYFCRYCSQKLK